jgi:peptidyl-prolyl cis-trans isomerase B (cyclophilin B)
MHAQLSPLLRAPARTPGRAQAVGCSRRSATAPARAASSSSTRPSDARAEDLAPESTSTSGGSSRRAAILGLALAGVVGADAAAAADDDDAGASPARQQQQPQQQHPRVFLDVSIEGEPAGRLEIELLPEAAPVGARRFADLAEEKDGVGYRLGRFDGVFVDKGYVRNAGARSLSYRADGASPIAGGDSTLDLERELDDAARRLPHDRAGLVSLIVREPDGSRPPPKEKLVAVAGRLVTLSSRAGEAPNGSAFCITLAPAPELDRSNLVVGRLIGGDAALAALVALPLSRPREGIQKPFFDAGKAIGDSRAVVAEKGFFRPLKRAIVSNSGLL